MRRGPPPFSFLSSRLGVRACLDLHCPSLSELPTAWNSVQIGLSIQNLIQATLCLFLLRKWENNTGLWVRHGKCSSWSCEKLFPKGVHLLLLFPFCPRGQGGWCVPSEGDSKISFCVGPCRDWQGPHSTSFKYIPHRKVSETCDLGQSDLDLNFCVFFKKGIGPFEV